MDRLTHERNSGIKTGYWSPAKKEELVQHLAAYEDTKLTPEQIRDLDEVYLEKCREVTELKKRLEWIPVAERLPKCDFGYETDALLYQMRSTGTIEAGYYGRGGKIRDSYFRDYRNANDGVDVSDVIAWMPLPKPYRPED